MKNPLFHLFYLNDRARRLRLATIGALALCCSAQAAQLVVDTTEDTVGDDGKLSLREAVADAAASDEIIFHPVLAGQTIELQDTLVLTKEVSIASSNDPGVTLKGDGTARLFSIDSDGAQVSLSGLQVTGGGGVDKGGAFYVNDGDTLILSDVHVVANSADDGGGLYNDGGAVNIVGGSFADNVANGSAGSGGAIFNGPQGQLELSNTQIDRNRANRAGGGIEDASGEGLGLRLIDVSFNSNNAGMSPATAAPGNGGALHITGPGDSIISGGSSIGNVAAREGGGLWNGSGLMTLNGMSISGNQAFGEAADDGGGGLFNNGGTLTMTGGVLSDNHAKGVAGSGGGLFSTDGAVTISEATIMRNVSNRAGGGIELIDGSLTLTEVVLGGFDSADGNVAGPEGTAAPGNGGGLHLTNKAVVIIEGGVVGSNRAAREGGGLWNQTGSTMTLRDNVLVDSNVASGDAADDGGGGIFNNGGTLLIDGSTLWNNSAEGASGSGGGIFVRTGEVAVSNSMISGNVANRAGGGIEIVEGALVLTDVTLGGPTAFHANVAGADGAAAPGNGGGLHGSGVATITIQGGEVIGNRAAREGGGLWNQSGATMTVIGSMISENVASGVAADDGGGGIFNNGGTFVIENARIEANVADGTSGSGGGLFNNEGGSMTITSTVVANNIANRAGGGLEDKAGAGVIITGSQLTNNTAGPASTAAPGNGGAVHISGSGHVSIDTTTVSGNHAAKEGGGLWNSGAGTMTVLRSTIARNTSPKGAGFFSQAGAGMSSLTNTTISSNEASAVGGGISAEGGTVDLFHVTIANNKASNDGGGLHNAGGMVSLVNSLVANNMAPLGPDDSGAGIVSTRSFIGADPTLSPLGDFGGPTQTHLPMEGSAALNAGDNQLAAELATDQRGFARIVGMVDLGAVEADAVVMNDGVVSTLADTVSAFDGVTSLREAILFANSSDEVDMIALPEGTYTLTLNGADEDGAESGDLDITRSVTIMGSGPASVIDASGLGDRVFETLGSIEVTFANVTIKGGAAEDGGGLMNRGADVTIKESMFTENVANGASGSGGAIFNAEGGVVTIDTSLLSNNQANRAGGAIEDASGPGLGIILTNVDLISNNAGIAPATASPGNGGAVHITGPGDITIVGGTSMENVAAREGGALWNGSGIMTLTNHLAESNHAFGDAADDGGGGLFNNGGTIVAEGLTVLNNTALGTAGSGGGLFSTAGSVSLTGGSVSNNSANRAGGGIEILEGSLTVSTTEMLENVAGPEGTAAPGNGGALHVSGAATVVFDGATIARNRAAREGGGLWNQGGATMTLQNGVNVSDNIASGAMADDGGAGIFNNGGRTIVNDSTIRGNIAEGASGSGGGLFNNTGGILEISRSQVVNNVASRAGGGIEDNSGAGLGVVLTDVTLDGNTTGSAPGNGGGLHITGPGDATITGGSVSNNVAAQEGGGLWNGGGSMTVLNVDVLGNKAHGPAAHDGGGGLFNLSGHVIIEESKLSGNIADGASGSGGGVLTLAGSVTIMSANIEKNIANRAGGGIEVVEGTLTVSDLVLGGPKPEQGNVAGPEGAAAPGNGGGLHVSGAAEVSLDWCEVLYNRAALEGGGLWNQAGATMAVTNSNVSHNSAHGDAADDGGGGLFNNGGVTHIEKTELKGNIADGASGSGGGLFNHTGGSVTITDSQVVSNRANRAGGGIEDNSGAGLGLVLLNVNLDGNNTGIAPASPAPGNGGGLHITGAGDITIEGGTNSNNVAAREGGALWNGSGMMTISNSLVSMNVASGSEAHDGGGGLFNNGGSLTVMGTMITNNHANGASGSGGGIFSIAGPVDLFDTIVSSNVANRAGGGIEVIDGSFDLTNVMLGGDYAEKGNIAGPEGAESPGNGGGLHVTGTANVNVIGGQVSNNVAAREGGGLWNQSGATMTIKESTLISHNASEGDAVHDGGGGVFNNQGTLVMDGTNGRIRLFQNAVIGFDTEGGALQSIGGSVQLTAVDIEDNFAFQGSGVSLIDTELSMSGVMMWGDLIASGNSRVEGTGTIEGTATFMASVTLAPGALSVVDGNLLSGATYKVSLSEMGSSQLLTNGFLELANSTLSVLTLEDFMPENTDVFVIISNSSGQPVRGSFAGLPEWSTFNSNGRDYRITYKGGDGNDVVIMPVNGVGVGAVASSALMTNEAAGQVQQMVRLFNNGDTAKYVDRLLIGEVPVGIAVESASGTVMMGEPPVAISFQTIGRSLAPGAAIEIMVTFESNGEVNFSPDYTVSVGSEPMKPTRPFNVSEIVWLTGGDILIGFPSTEGALYFIEISSDLLTWNTATELLVGEEQFTTWVDNEDKQDTAVFYRVVRID